MRALVPILALTISAEAAAFDHSHAAWTRVLEAHVKEGRVDYAAVKEDEGLAAYLSALESVSQEEHAGFSKKERLAFWLNAYNAYTVKLIVDNLPVESIRTIGTSPFRREFIQLPAAGPDRVSLDALEHQIVRKRFAEPRIHFALVCAAKSCPPLRREAYRAVDLEAQLDEQTRTFLNDRRHNRWEPKTGVLGLSKLFEWFAADFTTTGKTIPAYAAQYLRGLDPKAVKKVRYLEYDWALND